VSGWITSATAQWIGSPASNGDGNTSVALGSYLYQTKFTLPKYVDPSSVVITGSVAASDNLTSLKINGADTGFSGAGSGSFAGFTINHTNGSFTAGDNVLSAIVQNTSGHNGLIVDSLALTYNLLPAPVINFVSPVYYNEFEFDGNAYLDGQPNIPLSFAIPATNNPTSYQALGLPPGLSINTATGVISGTPLVAESCPIQLTATNSYGFDTKALNLLVSNWTQLPTGIIPQAFGNGTYVAVDRNISYTSIDAINWTAHTVDSNTNQLLDCVTFGNGMFVTAGITCVYLQGCTAALYVSPDGVTWTPQSSQANDKIFKLAFGNNIFVGITRSMQVLTSSDGQHWSVQQLLSDDPGNRGEIVTPPTIIFGNNTFVIVLDFYTSNDSGIYSSRDAQIWSLINYPNNSLLGGAFASGVFVVPGSAAVETSLDGFVWTAHPPNVLAGESFTNGMISTGSTFLVLSDGRPGNVFFSYDGLNWRETIVRPPREDIALSFANGRCFASTLTHGLTHDTNFPPLSTVSFATSFSEVVENAGNATLTLTRTGDLTGTISILCDTPPIPPTTAFNAFANSFAAVDGTDFQGVYQTVVFNPGETIKTVSIPIINNTSSADGRREIAVELIAQTEGVNAGDPTAVRILDDDKSLQIADADNLQFTDNADKTVSFSANINVTNSKTTATGPTRVKLIAYPGYNFFDPSFDAPPSLPAATVVGIFSMANGVSGMSTAAVAVTGTIPAPYLSADGDVFWWVYAQLEEQVGANWYPTPGPWPLLDGDILLKNGGSAPPCGGALHCRDTGGAIGGGGGGGPLPILPPPPTLSSLAIGGPSQVNKGSSTQYTATGTLSDGSSVSPSNVTWSASAFSISSTGVFTASSVKTDTLVTLTASTTVAGVTQSGSTKITVRKSKTSLATPTISPNGGTFAHSVQVTLSDVAVGATIRYTTNGSTPGKKSPVYSGPLTLTSNATVNAIATASGASNSSVASATFTITP